MLEWHRIISDKVPRFIRMQDNISKRYGKLRGCVGKVLLN